MSRLGHYHRFHTASGYAAIAWNDVGVTRLCLPAPSLQDVERTVRHRLPGLAPALPTVPMATIVDKVIRYFSGERVNFSDTPIDLGMQQPFFTRVYAMVRRLEWGETTTYGAIAKYLGGGPEAARDVGQAMARNPVPLIVPCHRVIGAGGRIGGFSAPGGSSTKARMLALEGVVLNDPAQSEDHAPRFDF